MVPLLLLEVVGTLVVVEVWPAHLLGALVVLVLLAVLLHPAVGVVGVQASCRRRLGLLGAELAMVAESVYPEERFLQVDEGCRQAEGAASSNNLVVARGWTGGPALDASVKSTQPPLDCTFA